MLGFVSGLRDRLCDHFCWQLIDRDVQFLDIPNPALIGKDARWRHHTALNELVEESRTRAYESSRGFAADQSGF
jgi:hypothetical protein